MFPSDTTVTIVFSERDLSLDNNRFKWVNRIKEEKLFYLTERRKDVLTVKDMDTTLNDTGRFIRKDPLYRD